MVKTEIIVEYTPPSSPTVTPNFEESILQPLQRAAEAHDVDLIKEIIKQYCCDFLGESMEVDRDPIMAKLNMMTDERPDIEKLYSLDSIMFHYSQKFPFFCVVRKILLELKEQINKNHQEEEGIFIDSFEPDPQDNNNLTEIDNQPDHGHNETHPANDQSLVIQKPFFYKSIYPTVRPAPRDEVEQFYRDSVFLRQYDAWRDNNAEKQPSQSSTSPWDDMFFGPTDPDFPTNKNKL